MTFSEIKSLQNKYEAKHGKYFQVLKGGKSTSDERHSVDLTGFPVDIEIHEYKGPEGIGFSIIEEKSELGKVYKKSTGFGLKGETFDWREVIKI